MKGKAVVITWSNCGIGQEIAVWLSSQGAEPVLGCRDLVRGRRSADELERRPFAGMKAYAQSKACDRLLTWAFARRLEGTGVTINAEGADSAVWLASSAG